MKSLSDVDSAEYLKYMLRCHDYAKKLIGKEDFEKEMSELAIQITSYQHSYSGKMTFLRAGHILAETPYSDDIKSMLDEEGIAREKFSAVMVRAATIHFLLQNDEYDGLVATEIFERPVRLITTSNTVDEYTKITMEHGVKEYKRGKNIGITYSIIVVIIVLLIKLFLLI